MADEWVGGRVQMPAYVTAGEPFRPDVVLWLDTTNEVVVGHKVIKPDAPPEVAVDLLQSSFAEPMAGRPRRPARIRVADSALAELVRRRVGDIPVEVAPTPELDGFLDGFSESIRLDKDEGSYLGGGRIAAATVARFFQAAARLYRAAPWRHVHDGQLLWIDSPDLSLRERCVSVLGNLGESYGLLIFDSVAAFKTMVERGKAMMAGEKTDLGVSIFALNFDQGADVPKAMRREVAEHHWEVVDANAYPNVLWIDPDRLARPLTEHDLDCAAACAEAVAAFFAKHGDAFTKGSFSSARERFRIESLPGEPTVEVAAPHPEADWPEDDAEDEDVDLDAEMARGQELVEAFLAAERQAGRDDEWLDAAQFVAQDLYTFKVQYADGAADRWTALLVEEYLLDYFPRKVSAGEELIARVPEVAGAFFAWLTESGRLTARTGQAIRKRILQKAKAFARTASDPERIGMAKSFAMAMKDAGVDLSDPRQIEGYVDSHNASLGRDAPFPGLIVPSAPAQRAEAPRALSKPRWVWSGQGPAPDPQAPCPCGSGKRYKKCCMPR